MTREFERRLAAGTPLPREERLEAGPAEREALAGRLGLLELRALSATLALRPAPGGVRAEGRMRAEVVQPCSVTLEPVEGVVEAALDWILLPPGEAAREEDEEGPDEIEREADGSADLGEALAQELSLSLDPYPRAPDAELPEAVREGRASPFAGLEALRRG